MLNNTKSFSTSLRYLSLIFVLIVGLAVITASGGGGSDDSSETTENDTNDRTPSGSDDTTDGDTSSAYDPDNLPNGPFFTDTINLSGATVISLNGTSISISGAGTGVSVNGTVATITDSGTYSINGTLDNGQIKVDVDTDSDAGDVWLYFDGVDITSATAPPVDIESAERVIICLADSKYNYLTDAYREELSYLDEDGDDVDAALYSKDDLVICGTGDLTVTANYLDGIKSKDGLIIQNSNINVTSEDDAITGKNYVSVEDGNIIIDAGGDGLKSTDDPDTEEEINQEKHTGYIYIQDGAFDINAGVDAIQSETHIVVKGGTFDLITDGGSNYGVRDDETAKGFKTNIGITIDGGTFIVDSADDSFHSDDTIIINGGNFSDLASADDAFHSELALTINNAATIINVTTCFEGIESKVITINDGDIHIKATNDPINASAGSGDGMIMPMQGGGGGGGGGTTGGGMEVQEGVCLYINGGYMALQNINTNDSDGFDSNGSIEMTGGIVIINGGVGMNGIMDYGSFAMDGGFIIGAGTKDMPQSAGDTSSTQNSVFVYINGTAGTLFHVQRSDGVNVVTFAPSIDFGAIEFSSPLLVQGSKYNVYTGGSTTGTNNDGLYGTISADNQYDDDGDYTPGDLETTFTVTSVATNITIN